MQRLLDEVEPILQELRRMPPGPERKCGPIQKPYTLHQHKLVERRHQPLVWGMLNKLALG